jgi:uncharacterized protein YunC (DUF1805 family)
MSKVLKWANTIGKLEKTFALDMNKIHLLGIADGYWAKGGAVKVTELLKLYNGASRATTHRAIQELVEAGLMHMVGNNEDKRVRLLHPGKKIAQLEKLL